MLTRKNFYQNHSFASTDFCIRQIVAVLMKQRRTSFIAENCEDCLSRKAVTAQTREVVQEEAAQRLHQSVYQTCRNSEQKRHGCKAVIQANVYPIQIQISRGEINLITHQ